MGTFGTPLWGTSEWGAPAPQSNPGGSGNPGIPGAPGTTPGEFNNPSPLWNSGATNNAVPPGSTSSVAGFIPDVLMIIQEACERAGVDFDSPYALRTAKRSIDLLAMEWANEGLNLWTLDNQVVALVPGIFQYTMPADTVDMLTPAIRTTANGAQTDLIIGRQDFADYHAIPNKLYQARPINVFVQRLNVPVMYLWPVPDQAYQLTYWRMRRIQNTGYATNLIDIPFRFVPALVAGLAWQLALKKKVKVAKDWITIKELELIYRTTFLEAKREDTDRSSIFIAPSL